MTDWAIMLRLAVQHWGMRPADFWNLSWREWQALSARPDTPVLNRTSLETLMTFYPDG